MKKIFFHCECDGDKCDLQVKIPTGEYKTGERVIVSGCKNSLSDRWIPKEIKDGYSVYRSL